MRRVHIDTALHQGLEFKAFDKNTETWKECWDYSINDDGSYEIYGSGPNSFTIDKNAIVLVCRGDYNESTKRNS